MRAEGGKGEKSKGKFCPRCGRHAEKFYNNLCKNCFPETISLAEKLPSRFALRQCKNCGRIYVNDDFGETIEGALDILLRELLADKKMQPLHAASYRIEGRLVHVTLVMNVDDVEKIEKKDVELVVKTILCERCAREGSGYFQSIMQLRAPTKELTEALFDDVQQQIELMSHYDQHAFISKIERKKEGLDLYIGSKKVTMQISKNIKNKFNANVVVSRKLAGKKQGQKVYRDTVLVRIGEKKKGRR